MKDKLVGLRLKLRLYVPAEGDGAVAAGTISKRVVKERDVEFHDGFIVQLDDPVGIGDFEIDEVYIVPSGRYPFVRGHDKMSDLFDGPVHTTVSWQTPSGEWISWGQKGTFAEVSILI